MLFDKIVYGPIHSRRLGYSLGINLMPTNGKLCTFNCIYCECGWNEKLIHPQLPTTTQVREELEHTLKTINQPIDVITFSGNGEPTLHPDFEQIIDLTIELRNLYCPQAKITVLSNSTQLDRPDVVGALKRIDNPILKLDSAIDHTMRLIDLPNRQDLTVSRITELLQQFDGNFILQTCFLSGEMNGEHIDNTTDYELSAWLRVVESLKPRHTMIYVIDRATPLKTLNKISAQKMNQIADMLRQKGLSVSVSA